MAIFRLSEVKKNNESSTFTTRVESRLVKLGACLGCVVLGATAPLVDSFFAGLTQMQQLVFVEPEEFCCR